VRAADPAAPSSPPARGRPSAPTPEGLGARAARLGELRFLGEAFDRLSREYPATRDGLSLTERRVLAAVADGAPDAGTAFVRAGARETRPYMGDTTCFGRMDRMAQRPHPLLRLDPPARHVKRTTGVYLTNTGARVLAGEADQITLNGIDRWIGGVHLQGHHVPWRWDDGTETIVYVPHKPRLPTDVSPGCAPFTQRRAGPYTFSPTCRHWACPTGEGCRH
jgi:hypothetical protein